MGSFEEVTNIGSNLDQTVHMDGTALLTLCTQISDTN